MEETKTNQKELNLPQFISLAEAAKISGYTAEHLNLLSRKGILQAEKIGHNWNTTKKWLDKYLASRKNRKTSKGQQIISLSEAAKISGYTAEHLNLLSRKGILKGKKVGRNWNTTQKWLEDFLAVRKNRRISQHQQKERTRIIIPSKPTLEPEVVLPKKIIATAKNQSKKKEKELAISPADYEKYLPSFSQKLFRFALIFIFFWSASVGLAYLLAHGQTKVATQKQAATILSENPIFNPQTFVTNYQEKVGEVLSALDIPRNDLSSELNQKYFPDPKQPEPKVAGAEKSATIQSKINIPPLPPDAWKYLLLVGSAIAIAFLIFWFFYSIHRVFLQPVGTLGWISLILFFLLSSLTLNQFIRQTVEPGINNIQFNNPFASNSNFNSNSKNGVQISGEKQTQEALVTSAELNTRLFDYVLKDSLQKNQTLAPIPLEFRNQDFEWKNQEINLAKDSIDSREIARHAIQAEDIDTGSITSRTISNHTIQGEDIDPNTNINLNNILSQQIIAETLVINNEATTPILNITNLIDLGTNTIADGQMIGNWDWNGGDLTNINSFTGITGNLTTLNLTTLDLGINTIADGNFTGDWNWNGGDLMTTGNITTGTLAAGATTLSGDLDMQTNIIQNIGNANTNFTATGGLTLAGNLDVNGLTNDIAGTLNLSGNALTASGLLTVTPALGLTVNTNGPLILNAAGQNITLETQNFDVNATGNVTLDGTNFTYTPTGTYTVTPGGTYTIDAAGTISLDSDASATLSGAGVNLTSDGANAITLTYAAAGGTFELTDGTTRLEVADNGNLVLGDDGATTIIDGSLITLSGNTLITGTITETLTDNSVDALDIQEGVNNYININTTNTAEAMQFGNTTTNPSYSFLGTGLTTMNGGINVVGNGTIGTNSANTLAINSVIASDVIPAGNARDFGSDSNRWEYGYFTNIDATNISGVIVTGSTASNSWTINSDNVTNNAEIASLVFRTGTLAPINAVLQWNATNDPSKVVGFDNSNLFNFPIAIYSKVNGANQTFTSGSLFKFSQPASDAITQSGAFIGANIDFSSNLTVPNNASGNQTGFLATLKDGGAGATAIGFQTAGTLDYGLDLGGTIGTADIRLSNLETIDNLTNGTILLTAPTTKTSGNLTVGTTGTGTITSGLINGQTISAAANFTGTINAASTITAPTFSGALSGNATSATNFNNGTSYSSGGNVYATTFNGALSGNATSATTAGTATNFSGSLAGDVTGTQGATVVGNDSHSHTSTTVPSSYTALSITTMTGNVTGNVSGSSASFTGSLAGDVTGTQGATVVGNDSHTHTSTTLPSSYSALTITTMTGNITGSAASFTGSLAGDVTGTQGATVVGDNSHAHDGSTISGLAVADFTSPNLSLWTNNLGWITSAGTATNFSGSLAGDVTGTQGATVVGDNSHAHDGATISGLAVADFTSPNLSLWTNNLGWITSAGTATNFSGSLSGDVTGTQGATVVGDNSHAHDGTTISGLAVADFASPNLSLWTNNLGWITNDTSVPKGDLANSGTLGFAWSDAEVSDTLTANALVSGTSPTLGTLYFYGVGGNSGQAAPSSDYRIYQAPGAWTSPFPDLNIAYHTGISIGAYSSYGGTRFFNNSDMVTEIFSVGNGDNNVRVAYNLYVAGSINGSGSGLTGVLLKAGSSVDAAGYVGLSGGTTYGIGVESSNRNSAVFDTIDSSGADTLELNYYSGGAVTIGNGGTKELRAGSYSIGGTNVIDGSRNLVNIGTITSGLINGQTISSAANLTGSLAVAGNVGIGGAPTSNGPLEVKNTNPTGDGAVFGAPNTDNNFVIQSYIDTAASGGGWAGRTTYAGGCCNNLALQPDAGTVMIGGTTGNLGYKFQVNGTSNFTGTVTAPTFSGALSGTATAAGNLTGHAAGYAYADGGTATSAGNLTGHAAGYAYADGGTATNATYSNYLSTNYVGGVQTNPQTYFNNSIGLKVAMTGYPSTWSDTLWINGYAGSDVPNMIALHFIRNGTPRMWISSQSNLASSYGTAYEVITGYNIASQIVATAGNLTGHAAGYAYADGGIATSAGNLTGHAAGYAYADGGTATTAGTANAVSFNGGLTTGSTPTFANVNAAGEFYTSNGLYTRMNYNQFYCNNASSCYFNWDGTGKTYVGNAAGTILGGSVGIGTTAPGLYKLSVLNNDADGRGINLSLTGAGTLNRGLFSTVSGTATSNIAIQASVYGAGAGTLSYGVNTTAASGGTNYGIYAVASGGTTNWAGYFSGSGYLSGAAWTYGSDARLKENISYLDNISGLEKIMALKPARFDYINGGVKNNLGFIAQDVQSVIPEAVSITDPTTGMLGLKTDFILPYMVNAIKELNQRTIGIRTSGQGDVTIAGNVGIGTTNPLAKLEIVDGNIQITNGSIIVNSVNLSDQLAIAGGRLDKLTAAQVLDAQNIQNILAQQDLLDGRISGLSDSLQSGLDATNAKILSLESKADDTKNKTSLLGMNLNFVRGQISSLYGKVLGVETSNVKEEVSLTDFASENIYQHSSLDNVDYSSDSFGGTYSAISEFKEIGVDLPTGIDLSQYDTDKAVLQFEVYIQDASLFQDFATELGNNMDEKELQWEESAHPWFTDGWNIVRLPLESGAKTGEIDWSDLKHFRAYFKFSGRSEVRIKNVAIEARKKAEPIAEGASFALDGQVLKLDSLENQNKLILALDEKAGQSDLVIKSQDNRIKDVETKLADQTAIVSAQTELLTTLKVDGILYKDELGNLNLDAGSLTAANIEASQVKTDTLEMTDNKASGKSFIPAGLGEIVIETPEAYNESKIYITATGSSYGKIVYVSEEDTVPGVSFKVKFDGDPVVNNIKFNWLIIK